MEPLLSRVQTTNAIPSSGSRSGNEISSRIRFQVHIQIKRREVLLGGIREWNGHSASGCTIEETKGERGLQILGWVGLGWVGSPEKKGRANLGRGRNGAFHPCD